MRRNQQDLQQSDYHQQRVINEQFQSFGAKQRETPRIGVPESVSPRQPNEHAGQFKIEVEDDVDDGVNSNYQMPNTPMNGMDSNTDHRLSVQQPMSVHRLTNKSKKSSAQRYQSFKNHNNHSMHGSQVSSQTDPPFRGQSIVSDHMRQKISTMRKGSTAHSPEHSNAAVTKIHREEPSYKNWAGEQIFFLNGKIQVGINLWQPTLTFVLINVLMLATLANTMRELQSKFGGFEVFILIGIALDLSASVLLWVTATKDPASIPSRRYLVKTYQRRIDYTTEEPRMQKYMDILNGRITRVKYCEDCDIYRPPRTIHCGLCGCCIERLDHHCPWIGTCVGKRNYKYFLFFLWSVFLSVCYGIIFGIVHISSNMQDEGKENNFTLGQILSIVIVTLASFLGIFVFFLFGYHQYLLCRNETTNENLKKTFGKLGNPFYRGCLDNVMRLLRRDKRNWKPEEIVVREEEQYKIHRNSQPRQLMRQSYNSSMQGGQVFSGNQEYFNRNSSMASRNMPAGDYENIRGSVNEDWRQRQTAQIMNIQRESDLTNMNGDNLSNMEFPRDMRPSEQQMQQQQQQPAKPISHQELNKLFGSNINEGRRAKNRKTSQESELAKRANAEALQRLQSNAHQYDGEVIQEHNNEADLSENMGHMGPLNVNDIKLDDMEPKGEGHIKLPLNNGISAMNTEQQISVLDQSEEQVLEDEGLDTRTREDQLVKSDLKSQGIYQTSTTQKAASSNLGLNPNVSNLMNSIQKGQQQYKNKKE